MFPNGRRIKTAVAFIQRSDIFIKAKKVVKRVYDFREQMTVFFSDKVKIESRDLFIRDEKLNQISYLADVSGLLNQRMLLCKLS
jgi:uncharacterized Fe-S cluster-containing MiaB family protein